MHLNFLGNGKQGRTIKFYPTYRKWDGVVAPLEVAAIPKAFLPVLRHHENTQAPLKVSYNLSTYMV